MSYTISQSPNTVTPAFNDNVFVVTSSNYTQPNFQFIAQVYDASNNLIVKLKRPVETGTAYGWFNVGRIIETYLTYNQGYSDTAASKNLDSYFEYYIKFGEEYGSTVTEHLNLATSSTIYTWNACLKTYEFPLFTIADWQYDNANGAKGKFLTPIRNHYPTTLTQQGELYFLQKPSAPANRVQVIAYDSAGSTTTSVFATSLTTNASDFRMIRIPAHPVNLNAIGSLVSGTPGSVIPATTEYYTIQLLNTASVLGEELRFDIRCPSNFTTPVYLYWLNRYGGFDSMIFDALNEYSSQSDRKNFYKNPRSLSSGSYSYSASGNGTTTFETDIAEKVKLRTRFLNATEAELLDHLATSPIVFMLKGGQLVSVNITGNSHQKKTGEEFQAFQYDFDVEYSLKDKVQRF